MNNSTKRLFLAVSLDEENIRLCNEFIKVNESLPVKWIRRDNWHITTIFLGDFPENLVPLLKNDLKNIFKPQMPFEIEFDCFCLAPDKRYPKMIWAKYRPCKSYDTLVEITFSGLKKFYRENKLEFNISLHKQNIPHVTLSRLKPGLVSQIIEINTSQKLQLNYCILFESVLRPQGSLYLEIDKFVFG